MELILKYFPELTPNQNRQFNLLPGLYYDWNSKINVISRKDIDFLEERHILHSLSLAKIINPAKGTTFLDVGTGGGFPGIPLAIMFPDSKFHLVDSIGKKILVVQDVIEKLGLTNVDAEKQRVEELKTKYDFIISRAVTDLAVIYKWTKNLIGIKAQNSIANGILYLKGGEIENEIKSLHSKTKIFEISDFFSEPFYQTKKIIHIYNG